MFNLNNPFDNFFQVQREFDRMFNQFWTDLPARTTNAKSSFQVDANDEQWRIDVPLPGIDPKNVSLEVAGNTLTIRAEEPKTDRRQEMRYEQTLTIPQFLDLDKISASHRHGMLELTVPIRDAVKPRRIQIAAGSEDGKQLNAEKRQLTNA
jgi:HSP20 family protein